MVGAEASIPRLSGIHHLKVPVTDVERSARWYSQMLSGTRRPELDHRSADGQLYAIILEIPGLPCPLELRHDPCRS
jgi:hypothetical protein